MDILNTGKTVAQREDEGTVVAIRDEAGEKMYQDDGVTPVTITVVGTYSGRYRRLIEGNNDRAWKRAGRMDAEESRKASLETIAGCILAWDGFTSGGQPFPLTKANACLLLDQCPWIREQVEKAMTDHSLFSTPVSSS